MTTNYDEHNYKRYSCPICGKRYRAREDSNEYLNRYCAECESKKHSPRYPIHAECNRNELKWPDTHEFVHLMSGDDKRHVDRIDAGIPITFDQDGNNSTAISPANVAPKAEAMTWACICGNRIPVTQDGKVMLHNIHGELLNVKPSEICRGSNKILHCENLLNTAIPEYTHVSIGTDRSLEDIGNDLHPLLSGTGKLPSKKKSNKKIKAYTADAVIPLEITQPNDETITEFRYNHNGSPIHVKHRYTPYGDIKIKIAPDKDGVISIW